MPLHQALERVREGLELLVFVRGLLVTVIELDCEDVADGKRRHRPGQGHMHQGVAKVRKPLYPHLRLCQHMRELCASRVIL